MKIFKLFYSLASAYKTNIILNIVVLVALAVPISIIYTNNVHTNFEQVELSIGIVNHDTDNLVTENFIEYLDNQADVSEIEDDAEVIADALYYENANYVLEIPSGFGDSLLENEDILPLEKSVSSGTTSETYVDIIIENYINNFQIIHAGTASIDDTEAVQETLDKVNSSIAENIEVTTATTTNLDAKTIGFGMSYTHLTAFSLVMTLITIFGLPMMAMRNPEIVKRDQMGNITVGRRNTELFLACSLFALGLWLFIMIIGGFIYGFDTLTSTHGLLFLLSSFVSMIGIQQMAFFIVTVAPNKGMVSFMSTAISLLIAFTSGLFVPREFVSPIMQQIAQVATPIWQVKADEIIVSAETLSQTQLNTVFQYMGIQLLIALAYASLTYIYRRYKVRM